MRALARAGAPTASAGLFATRTGLGAPQDHMFPRAADAPDHRLSAQTRSAVGRRCRWVRSAGADTRRRPGGS